jgi:predicted DNA-binding protein (MmcQ/YjbR family)
MDLPDVIAHCLSKPGAEEDTPFGPDVLVCKVGGKLFALADPGEVPARVNLKCDPDRAIALREEHAAIVPGYHMNKRHWNTVVLDGSLPPSLVRELIDHSYALVAAGLRGNARAARRDPGERRPRPRKPSAGGPSRRPRRG